MLRDYKSQESIQKLYNILDEHETTEEQRHVISALIDMDPHGDMYWCAERMFIFGVIIGKQCERKKKRAIL